MSGVFIAFEGPEGAGKSTQVRLLEEWLRARGLDPLLTREPGGTPVAEEVRRILLESESLSARAELLLMLASRATLVEAVIRPALESGRVVVTDRFHLSTLVYQGHGRGLPLDRVEALNRFATVGLEPDLTLLLDVDPEVGAARKARARQGADRIERAGAAFHQKVAGAYRLLAQDDDRIQRVDATGSADAVHAAVVQLVTERLPETFGSISG